VGLKKTFKDIAALYSKQPDDVVAEELLNRLSKNTQEEKWTNPYL
jgi:hypothetical protein